MMPLPLSPLSLISPRISPWKSLTLTDFYRKVKEVMSKREHGAFHKIKIFRFLFVPGNREGISISPLSPLTTKHCDSVIPRVIVRVKEVTVMNNTHPAVSA